VPKAHGQVGVKGSLPKRYLPSELDGIGTPTTQIQAGLKKVPVSQPNLAKLRQARGKNRAMSDSVFSILF